MTRKNDQRRPKPNRTTKGGRVTPKAGAAGQPGGASRPTASVVIPAWNQWAMTEACLDAVLPTLAPGDEVIVVDNGSTDGTAADLARYPSVTVVRNEVNLGFATACNQGASSATGEVVVFLNNDTVPLGRWLDALVAPFADPTVGATGSRSNYVAGAQLVPRAGGAYQPGTAVHTRYVRSWEQQHWGQTTEVDELIGFCLAVRRSALDALGGFDQGYGIGGYEDDDLCIRLADAGHRLLIAHGSYVHHHGHATFDGGGLDRLAIQQENERRYRATHGPLLSACLIVKDEEVDLPSALASAARYAEEIVVYDTGSTDRTVEIARRAGAVVVEGYWDDDFGRARNDALAACTGKWILHLDADETLEAEPQALRRRLHEPGMADVVLVAIDNLDDAGQVGIRHQAARLFRRRRAHWQGHLHEQVVSRPGQRPLTETKADGIRIVHTGYQQSAMDTKDKSTRNIRMAEAELASGEDDTVVALLNLSRALAAAGRYQEALDRSAEARGAAALAPAGSSAAAVRTAVLHLGCELQFTLGRAADAIGWVDELRRVPGATADLCDFLEGTARLLLGERCDLLVRLGDVAEIANGSGLSVTGVLLRNRLALALAAAERWDEAADALAALVTEAPDQAVWVPLTQAWVATGRDPEALAALVTDDRLRAVLAQLLPADAALIDGLAEALWQRFPGDPRLVGFATHHAPRVATGRCLEWAARVRTAGLVEHCPLVARAQRDSVDSLERLRATAVAAGFGDGRAPTLLRHVTAAVPADRFGEALLELDQLAPNLLPGFVEAAASDRARCTAMADALDALGATAEAQTVRAQRELLSA